MAIQTRLPTGTAADTAPPQCDTPEVRSALGKPSVTAVGALEHVAESDLAHAGCKPLIARKLKTGYFQWEAGEFDMLESKDRRDSSAEGVFDLLDRKERQSRLSDG